MATSDLSTSTLVAPRGSPADRMLTAALVVGPLLMLGADALYAFQGWDSGAAGVLHVLAAVGYGLLAVRIASWLRDGSWLTTTLLLTAIAGSIGNATYGFEAIHQSFGDTPLVDRSGAAALIKPFGILFPLSLLLVAVALRHLDQRGPAAAVLVAAVLWPVAHIANIAPLAVAVNIVLVVALGTRTSWTSAESLTASPALAPAPLR